MWYDSVKASVSSGKCMSLCIIADGEAQWLCVRRNEIDHLTKQFVTKIHFI